VSTLGHKVFDEKRESKQKEKVETFFIKATRGADALGELISDGFLVFKGSKAPLSTVSSITPSFANLRTSSITDGILKLIEDSYQFTEDYIFSSPSTAAVIVMGRNANGLTEWKLSNGKTLKDFESEVK
jgi:hypothetical protein